jgi:hypothetical protein
MLYEIYTSLLQNFPNECDFLYGSQLEVDGLWLSVDEQGFPCLLFDTGLSDRRNDIAFRSIDVEFSRECTIAMGESEALSGCYSIVRLNENDADIVRVFLGLLEDAFLRSNRRYSNREIGEKILELADLFSRIEDAKNDIVGLWGELYLIYRSKSVADAVRCWCRQKNAKYDFVSDGFALEVKTTLNPRRKHRFSIDQLRTHGEFDIYVASLKLVEMHSGITVSSLLEEVRAQISDDELRSDFLKQCFLKGGRDIYRSDLKLRLYPDDSSLSIFQAVDIPVPNIDPSDPIDNVRFDVDLSGIVAIDGEHRARILNF